MIFLQKLKILASCSFIYRDVFKAAHGEADAF
jgi:hypothetical protein